MRRLLAVAVLGALAASGTALADHLDPQEKFKSADQKRAKAMLLKQADFGQGVQAHPNAADPHINCTPVDLSDLTLTGDAETPTFVRGLIVANSAAQVYRTVSDSNTGWRRTTGAAGTKCLREVIRDAYAKQGFRLQSLRKLGFPRISQRTVASRIVLTGESQGVTVRFTLDVITLLHSRAQVALAVGSLSPPARAEELRLVRLVAKRMATAMRGS